MKFIKALFIPIILLFAACSPKVTTKIAKSYPALSYDSEIAVLAVTQQQPDNAELLGELKIGDAGLSTKCTYEDAIAHAKLEARKIGGNMLKLTEHKLPSAIASSCHRISAKILRVPDNGEWLLVKEEELLDVDYAIINVYRHGGMGSLIAYNINLGDSTICRVKNNYKTTIHIKKEGLNTLWAKTESKTELPINLVNGKQYYLKCGISMGAFVGRPTLELVDSDRGKAEFEALKAKNQ